MMSFTDAVKICFTKKFVKTSGRASRAEFWWFYLFRGFQWPCYGLGFLIAVANPHNDIANIFGGIFWGVGIILSLITCIPYICVFIRRLHDINMSGKYLLWSFLFSWPIVHFCGLVINTCKGDKGPNQYGPDPLDPQSQKINPQPITEGITKVTIIEDKQTEEIIDVEL